MGVQFSEVPLYLELWLGASTWLLFNQKVQLMWKFFGKVLLCCHWFLLRKEAVMQHEYSMLCHHSNWKRSSGNKTGWFFLNAEHLLGTLERLGCCAYKMWYVSVQMNGKKLFLNGFAAVMSTVMWLEGLQIDSVVSTLPGVKGFDSWPVLSMQHLYNWATREGGGEFVKVIDSF